MRTRTGRRAGKRCFGCAQHSLPVRTRRQGSEQLTFLRFLKMADEQSRAPFNKPSPISKNVDWQSLMRLDGYEPEMRYATKRLENVH